ncbi:MAG TPA: hypothetical protein VFW74_12395 [Acidimicrobiia bacterium]|nr:hypothetical protein [Acidimicrobiia bacterium]
MRTVGELLGRCLREAGVTRVYGDPVVGLDHLATGDGALAALLADADGRLGPAPGVALTSGSDLRVTSRPGGSRDVTVVVDDAHELGPAITRASVAARFRFATTTLRLALDLDAPAPPDAQPARLPILPLDLRAALPSGPVVVLAGPGVVRAGSFPWGDAVDGLRAFAAASGLGVVNTWGAKGVFQWDSPHHLGTAGLQADDFALLGFGDVELIVATGVDTDESAPDRFGLAPVAHLSPIHLASLADHVTARPIDPPANELYARMSSIAQPGYADTSVPLHPARAVADVRAALPPDGLVAADPGVAGLWFARTFPTSVLGSVVVPATRAPGIAAALAFVAETRGRRAIAVTTEPVDDMTRRVVDLAHARGVTLTVETWCADGALDGVDAHEAGLRAGIALPAVHQLRTPVALARTQDLVDAAGPVVAWGGLDGDS